MLNETSPINIVIILSNVPLLLIEFKWQADINSLLINYQAHQMPMQ